MNGTISQTIQAGTTQRFPSGKNFLLVGNVNDVTVTFYDHRNRPLERFENITAPFAVDFEDGFMGVSIYSATTQTIKITVTNAKVDYKPTGGTISADPVIPISIVTTPDVSLPATTTTVIKASNGNRNEIMISNLDPVSTLRIGDSNTGAARGTILPPLSSLTLVTQAAVYGYNPSASAILAAVLELE